MGNLFASESQQPSGAAPQRSWADVAQISAEQHRRIATSYATNSEVPLTGGQGPAMHKAANVRVAANVIKDSIKVVESDGNKLRVTFAFDAETSGIAHVHAVVEKPSTENGKCTRPADFKSAKSWTSRFESGQGQKMTSEAVVDANSVPHDHLLYHKNSKTIPIVIVLERTGEQTGDQRLADNQCVMLTLTKENEAFGVQEFQRAVTVGSTFYIVKELYGGQGSSAAANEDEDDLSTDCVICLTEERNTTILPCMHACLCVECAKRLSSSNSKCPLCRSQIKEFWQL